MNPWRVALALTLLAPLAHAAEVCQLDPAAAPDKIEYVEAVVVGPASDAEVLAQTRIAILRTKAPVSPAYVKLPRITAIFRDSQGLVHKTIAAVLSGPPPPRGAHVTLASRHRDPNQPCAFVPWTVAKPGDAA
jgi:hypothetical protein